MGFSYCFNYLYCYLRYKLGDQMKIIVMGDIHGKFELLNEFISKEQPNIILQAGDNAYYWGKDNTERIKPQNTKIYMIPGNHENWDMFEERIGRHGKDPIEIEKNIFMCPIGSTLEINNQIILFIGGADSVDKSYRLPKISWWEQEILTFKDYEYIEQNVKKADIVISHTCPTYFNVGMHYYDKLNDPSRRILNLVCQKYEPKIWMFGHWHESLQGTYKETKTKWIALNMIDNMDNEYWYKYLIL
jgi:Icc-related predicted phosphoesterase